MTSKKAKAQTKGGSQDIMVPQGVLQHSLGAFQYLLNQDLPRQTQLDLTRIFIFQVQPALEVIKSLYRQECDKFGIKYEDAAKARSEDEKFANALREIDEQEVPIRAEKLKLDDFVHGINALNGPMQGAPLAMLGWLLIE